MLLVMCLAMLLAMLLAALLRAFLALPGDLTAGGDLLVPPWALPLGASSGCFHWALPQGHVLGDASGDAPALLQVFLARPGDAPGDLPAGRDLLVPSWALPLGASYGCFLWAMFLVMLLAMLRRSCGPPWHFLAMLLGTFQPAETSLSHVGHFLWVLPLGASSGHFLWALPLGASSGRCSW